jgi:hypothetical protein
LRKQNLLVRFSVGLLILVLLAVATPVASAASTTQASAKVQTVSMKLDCDHLTPKAKKYADEHHYCDKVKNASGVQPKNTEEGTCGTTTLYIYQAYAAGLASFYEVAHSDKGPIVYVDRQISWVNYSTGQGMWVDDGFAASGDWVHREIFNTGSGYVTASMSGTVFLIWGGSCAIAYPTDSAGI